MKPDEHDNEGAPDVGRLDSVPLCPVFLNLCSTSLIRLTESVAKRNSLAKDQAASLTHEMLAKRIKLNFNSLFFVFGSSHS
jgi:hypothetical protein